MARSDLIDVRSLFAWAIRNKYLRENTALAVDLPRLEDTPPGVLTTPQCTVLLRCCRDAEPPLLPTLALCLLAGVRPDKARRLEWANLGPDFVEIPGHKAKTRKRRLVAITPQLRAWLDVARAAGGQLPVKNFPNEFNRVHRLAGLLDGWLHDAMRHSFASYHLPKHRNEGATALGMGNSPEMICRHYRALVQPADAEAFFGLLPDNLPAATSEAAAVAVKSPKPGRNRVCSKPVSSVLLAELFGQGSRTLTRQEAVRELCDLWGLGWRGGGGRRYVRNRRDWRGCRRLYSRIVTSWRV